ncbi:replication-relaxation family protein [Streptomyces sp. NPDC054950]
MTMTRRRADVDAGGGDRLAVLVQYRMATTEQMHLITAPRVRVEQTRRRLAKLRAEGLVDRITLPQESTACRSCAFSCCSCSTVAPHVLSPSGRDLLVTGSRHHQSPYRGGGPSTPALAHTRKTPQRRCVDHKNSGSSPLGRRRAREADCPTPPQPSRPAPALTLTERFRNDRHKANADAVTGIRRRHQRCTQSVAGAPRARKSNDLRVIEQRLNNRPRRTLS